MYARVRGRADVGRESGYAKGRGRGVVSLPRTSSDLQTAGGKFGKLRLFALAFADSLVRAWSVIKQFFYHYFPSLPPLFFVRLVGPMPVLLYAM
jgi:hypothetical protein